mgnify:FL=1
MDLGEHHVTASLPTSTPMSTPARSPEPSLLSVEIVTPRLPPEGEFWPEHTHPAHELLSAISHGVTVATDDSVHVLPRGSPLWIPAGCPHTVRAGAGNSMRCTWFETSALPDALVQPTVLTTTALLDAVLRHLDTEREALRRERAEAFALDLLSTDAQPDAGLPQPRTHWLKEVTTTLAASPRDNRTVEQWATSSAVSVRTFARRFQSETGMSFSEWRSRLRVQAAMADLAAGIPVASVARGVGFDSPSAFTTAFRRETGITPMAFARGTRA